MQQLGYAFADQQSAVFDSIQRLRRQAQTAGNLQSSPQQVVRQEQQTIIIQPADPNVVYVSSYNPTTVYGAWPYPSYPPVYLPPPAGYYFGTALATGLAFAAGAAVVGGLWAGRAPRGAADTPTSTSIATTTSTSMVRASIRPNGTRTGQAEDRPGSRDLRTGRSDDPPARMVCRRVRLAGIKFRCRGVL